MSPSRELTAAGDVVLEDPALQQRRNRAVASQALEQDHALDGGRRTVQRAPRRSRLDDSLLLGHVDAASSDEFVLWNFDSGSAKLKAGPSRWLASVVQAIRDAVTADADTQVDVEGEASSTGGAAANDTLGLKRATRSGRRSPVRASPRAARGRSPPGS